jgi:AcrR family transcriptional regulator
MDVEQREPRSGLEFLRPRKPQRANGRRRYELLLDAAERLLAREYGLGLTIQQLAREAGVPMASVYHFFPGPVAVSVALSERYMAGFERLVASPIIDRNSISWRQIIDILHQRAVGFYRAHPYAQKLLLGSDHSWAIRQADVANNRRIAGAVVGLIADKFPQVAAPELLEALVIGINVGDAVYAVSIAERGEITPDFAREATIAACAYLASKFESQAAWRD